MLSLSRADMIGRSRMPVNVLSSFHIGNEWPTITAEHLLTSRYNIYQRISFDNPIKITFAKSDITPILAVKLSAGKSGSPGVSNRKLFAENHREMLD